MKRLFIALFIVSFSLPAFAAEVTKGRPFQEYYVYTFGDDKIEAHVTTGKYKANRKLSRLKFVLLRDDGRDTLYHVYQEILPLGDYLSSGPKAEFEDTTSVVIKPKYNRVIVRFLVPAHMKLTAKKID